MNLFLYKLIITVILIFYTLPLSFAKDINKNIPSGIWLGNLTISGSVHCSGKINKILVEDSLVSFKGSELGGIIHHSYDLEKSNISNKRMKIFNVLSEFSLTLSKNKKSISLKLFNGCSGSDNFILMKDVADENNNESEAKADVEKDTTRLEDMLILAKTTCEEIGISDTDPKYGKCVLTLLKKQGYEDLLADASKTCDEIGIPETDPKYIQCVLTIFKKINK